MKQSLKWIGLAAAFVPLGVSVVDLYRERAVVESKSVEMEDGIESAFKELDEKMVELEKRLDAMEDNHLMEPRKPRKKSKGYKRAWEQRQ